MTSWKAPIDYLKKMKHSTINHFNFAKVWWKTKVLKSKKITTLKYGGTRFITFMVYLSNVLSGGRTVFPQLGISVQPVKGILLFQPQFEKTAVINFGFMKPHRPIWIFFRTPNLGIIEWYGQYTETIKYPTVCPFYLIKWPFLG